MIKHFNGQAMKNQCSCSNPETGLGNYFVRHSSIYFEQSMVWDKSTGGMADLDPFHLGFNNFLRNDSTEFC